MDPSTHSVTAPNSLPTMPASSRKRARENESPSQRTKREKAAERQRRKRERDRNASFSVMAMQSQSAQQQQQPQQQSAPPSQIIAAPPSTSHFATAHQELTPDDLARRERVRTAARERQRKHRALVKQKKLRELGLDMGNELMPGMEEVPYRVGAEGQYHPVLPHEIQHQPPPNPMAAQHEPPFPQDQMGGGQMFATTILLSFSCAPLLKQHLLRTLSMTSEELASLQPVIAQAWDQWDHQRRMHYAQQAQAQVQQAQAQAQQAAANSVKGPDGHPLAEAAPSAPYPNVPMPDHAPPAPYPGDPSQPPPNDFRARFQRPLVAPSPFRQFAAADTRPAGNGSATGSTPSVTASDSIDPHLQAAAQAVTTGDAQHKNSIDPELGQAMGEAEGVVGRLERG
ncbi:hypothetical protein EW146_g5465 [Bondarzewia mesenterica]|uniref:Uncharacterized protein n=1 Tax=Bondarzewia mesenterica TaxID=1095465 RepID=A0A4S4LTH8_9AGAM|nr:hypothetical protein EW146_g5465 [Bondarzewia mesenterica]